VLARVAADAGSAGVGRKGHPLAVVNLREVVMASAQPKPDFARTEWAVPGSNQRPLACKASALPTELTALD
jgi:hypothetical protein